MTTYDTYALVAELTEKAQAIQSLLERISDATSTINVLMQENDNLRAQVRELAAEVTLAKVGRDLARQRIRRMEEGDL